DAVDGVLHRLRAAGPGAELLLGLGEQGLVPVAVPAERLDVESVFGHEQDAICWKAARAWAVRGSPSRSLGDDRAGHPLVQGARVRVGAGLVEADGVGAARED